MITAKRKYTEPFVNCFHYKQKILTFQRLVDANTTKQIKRFVKLLQYEEISTLKLSSKPTCYFLISSEYSLWRSPQFNVYLYFLLLSASSSATPTEGTQYTEIKYQDQIHLNTKLFPYVPGNLKPTTIKQSSKIQSSKAGKEK